MLCLLYIQRSRSLDEQHTRRLCKLSGEGQGNTEFSQLKGLSIIIWHGICSIGFLQLLCFLLDIQKSLFYLYLCFANRQRAQMLALLYLPFYSYLCKFRNVYLSTLLLGATQEDPVETSDCVEVGYLCNYWFHK